jgi:non-ribosomal peptide synthetase component F
VAKPYIDQAYLQGFVTGLHLPMPTFRLSAEEQQDVIAYIFSRPSGPSALRDWLGNIADFLRDLTARGRRPAVISFGEDGVVTWDGATVADKARRLARGLQEAGVGRGSRVALWAPNSPPWIVAALTVLAAGGVLVPIDDLADVVDGQ